MVRSIDLLPQTIVLLWNQKRPAIHDDQWDARGQLKYERLLQHAAFRCDPDRVAANPRKLGAGCKVDQVSYVPPGPHEDKQEE